MGKKRINNVNTSVKVGEFETPRDEYIFSSIRISFEDLASKWKGVKKGYSFANLLRNSRKENWPLQRKDYQKKVRKEIDKRTVEKLGDKLSNTIVDANLRHMKLGQMMQEFGSSMIVVDEENKCMYIQDPITKERIVPKNVNEIVRVIKEGADLERKALGLADQVVKVQFARELGEIYFNIISKYIIDVTILKNIAGEIEGTLLKEEEKLENLKIQIE